MQVIALISLMKGDVYSTQLSGEICELDILQQEVVLDENQLRAWETNSDMFDRLFATSRQIPCDFIDLNVLAITEPWKL